MNELLKNADRGGAVILFAAALLMDGLSETAAGLVALAGMVALAGVLILLGNRAQERREGAWRKRRPERRRSGTSTGRRTGGLARQRKTAGQMTMR